MKREIALKNIELETRAMPEVLETRNSLIEEMESMVEKTKTEKRSFDQKESTRYKEIKSEIARIDQTLEAQEEQRQLGEGGKANKGEKRSADAVFADFIRGETRAVGEMDTTADGNIIPTELSKDIIKKVTETSDLFNKIKRINSTGKYQQIIETGKATAGWTNELAEVTATDGSYDLIEIGHHKLGALTKISIELINEASFDITGEVVDQISRSFAEKAEQAIIKGTGTGQPTGLVTSGVAVNLASKTAITADEIIDIYHSIKAPYMKNAIWLMNRGTLAALRKLKDADGQYIFQPDMTKEYVGLLLGKPIVVSEYVDNLGVSAKPILFGDLASSYIANIKPTQSIQMLRELFSTQGAVGVLGFLFFDGKPVNAEAYAVAKCPVV